MTPRTPQRIPLTKPGFSARAVASKYGLTQLVASAGIRLRHNLTFLRFTNPNQSATSAWVGFNPRAKRFEQLRCRGDQPLEAI